MTLPQFTLWSTIASVITLVVVHHWEKHKRTGRSQFAPMGSCYRAYCECGWHGPRRRSQASAVIDAATHRCSEGLPNHLHVRLERR